MDLYSCKNSTISWACIPEYARATSCGKASGSSTTTSYCNELYNMTYTVPAGTTTINLQVGSIAAVPPATASWCRARCAQLACG